MDEAKLKLLGLISTMEQGEALDFVALAKELCQPETTVRRWVKALLKEKEDGKILHMVDIERVLLDRVTAELKEEVVVAEEALHTLRINPITNVIEVVKPDAVTNRAATRLDSFRNGVTGLQLLREDLQESAGNITGKIAMLLEEPELNSKDLLNLTSSLTAIQNAFFNKPTTTVNVGVSTGQHGTSMLSSFRDGMKS